MVNMAYYMKIRYSLSVMDPEKSVPPVPNSDPNQQPEYHTPITMDPVINGGPDSHQGLRDIISIAAVLLSALVLAFGLISFVFQSYVVDGPSMQTTLQNNDHLIVWKVPRTWAKITRNPYIPKRGEVIIFNERGLSEFGQNESKQLIKRVIALPGERVVVKNGNLTVYNKENPNGFSPDKTMPYGKVITTTPGNIDVTIGEDQLYLCGDNRINSLDSRTFGPVDANDIIGKLTLRLLPLNKFEKF